MLLKWTRAVVRNRIPVVGIWVVVSLFGLAAGLNLNSHLTTSVTIPGSASQEADQLLAKHFNENTEGTFTVLMKFKKTTDAQVQIYKEKVVAASLVIPTSHIFQQRALAGVLFTSIGTSFSLIDAAQYTERFRQALDDQGLPDALVTGPPAIEHDVAPVLDSDLRWGQILAIVLALLLLLLVLGACLAMFVPLVFAAATISLALGIIYIMAHKMLMVLYIPNIIELIGLGLAIDYSLLIVHRFRRELMDDEVISVDEAIAKTMTTAGRTVILSGLSVSIGIATLLLVPVPFVHSLGAAGIVIPIVSVLAALTLQPAMLSILGRRGVTPYKFQGLMARKDLMSGMWARIGGFVIRRPISVLLAALAALALMASSVLWLHVTPSSLTAIPQNLESAQALKIVTERAGHGIITPNEIVIDLGAPHLARTPEVSRARLAFSDLIQKSHEVLLVSTDETATYIDPTEQYIRMFVVGRHDFGAAESQNLVHQIRENFIPRANFPGDAKIYLGGAPAQGVDLVSHLLKSFPWIVLLALGMAYIVLLRAFRSVFLPLKAILMDLTSIAVAYGALVLVFRFGMGSSILGTYRLDQIEAWVLVFLFPVLFGLSMDYEVFIVSRMREAKLHGATNNEAIVEGLAHTGGVVTAAAIILVGALGGLVNGHFAGLQEIGIGLAFGILIDATIIRGLLLPSTMVLLGRWNWWLPAGLARIVNVKASPLEDRETRP